MCIHDSILHGHFSFSTLCLQDHRFFGFIFLLDHTCVFQYYRFYMVLSYDSFGQPNGDTLSLKLPPPNDWFSQLLCSSWALNMGVKIIELVPQT